MDFAPSARASDHLVRLQDFMRDEVFPAEAPDFRRASSTVVFTAAVPAAEAVVAVAMAVVLLELLRPCRLQLSLTHLLLALSLKAPTTAVRPMTTVIFITARATQ